MLKTSIYFHIPHTCGISKPREWVAHAVVSCSVLGRFRISKEEDSVVLCRDRLIDPPALFHPLPPNGSFLFKYCWYGCTIRGPNFSPTWIMTICGCGGVGTRGDGWVFVNHIARCPAESYCRWTVGCYGFLRHIWKRDIHHDVFYTYSCKRDCGLIVIMNPTPKFSRMTEQVLGNRVYKFKCRRFIKFFVQNSYSTNLCQSISNVKYIYVECF